MLNYYQNITIKYSQSFTGKTCSPLLCYRFVTTALTAQIPAETLSQTHRVCFTQRQAFPTSGRGITTRIF